MGTIEETGFCSEDIQGWIDQIRKGHAEWFSICDSINEFAQSTMLSIKVQSDVLHEMVAATLLPLMVSNFQGIIILCERGMIHEAKAIIRSLLERVFALVAIDKNRAFCKALIYNDLHHRKRVFRTNIFLADHGMLDEKLKPEIEEALEKVLDEIENKQLYQEYRIRDIACEAGHELLYESEYRALSGSLHVNIRDCERYLDIDETSSQVKRILWGPNDEGMDLLLMSSAESMLNMLAAISNIFLIEYGDDWTRLTNKFNEQQVKM